MDAVSSAPTEAVLTVDGDRLRLEGSWTTQTLNPVADEALALARRGPWRLEASGVTRLDSNGSRLMALLGGDAMPEGLDARWHPLHSLVLNAVHEAPGRSLPRTGWLEGVGIRVSVALAQLTDLLATLGQLTLALLRVLREPRRLRWRETANVVVSSGAMAVPIIALLAFLLGGVLAYQGGIQLRTFGANIFIVELVTLTLFREFGPLITAIIVAGRSGAAFTAELATMRGNREIDALLTLGMSPVERLMVPKWLGLVIVMPLLTVLANAAGLAGGVLVADVMLNVDFDTFLERVPHVVGSQHFWVGIGKSVIFGMVIALVGCNEGMRARGDAESIGRNTTSSVVQSIFWVIVLDALFSILFNLLGW